MQTKRIIVCRRLLGLAMAVALLGGIGCSRKAASADRREEQNPLIKRARMLKTTQDTDGAIELYNKALSRDPALGRAHLEVGLLYDAEQKDYVRAIYHYQRYLELRPTTEKKEMIEELIRRARISFAASLPNPPPGAIEEIKELQEELASLKSKLADERARQKREQTPQVVSARSTGGAPRVTPAPPPRTTTTAPPKIAPAPPPRTAATQPPKITPAPAVTAATPRPAVAQEVEPEFEPPPAAAPAQPAVRTYRVQRGDTLSSVAAKMYEDPTQWKKVYEANRATLKSPESLRVGQVLIIPR